MENAAQMAAELVALRRQIHGLPELSFHEAQTSALAEKHLTEAGFATQGRIAESGFYADSGPNPSVAIRCEMDALPLAELNALPYGSKVPNICHACGHDAHVACVIGAARLLAQGSKVPIRIIMQPGEEQPDENGVAGAAHVVRSGALQGIRAIIGLHVDPTISTGGVAVLPISPEKRFAFNAEARGKNMIKSLPELLLSLHTQASDVRLEEVTALETMLRVSGCIISKEMIDVEMLKNSIQACFSGHETAISWNANEASDRTVDGERLVAAVAEVLGAKNVQLSRRKTWSASLNDYAQQTAAVLVLLGCEMRGDRRSQHTGRFDIDENCLPVGAAAVAAVAASI